MHLAFGQRGPHSQRRRPPWYGKAHVVARTPEREHWERMIEIPDTAERRERPFVARVRRGCQHYDRSRPPRQGAGGRTHLVSPAMAAAAALEGHFVDVRRLV